MKFAALLLALASLLGAPATADAKPARICATVDNVANAATWRVGNGPLHTAYYEDNGGEELDYDRPVPYAVRLADRKLLVGPPGPKVVRACTYKRSATGK